jgi:hypothetical protein
MTTSRSWGFLPHQLPHPLAFVPRRLLELRRPKIWLHCLLAVKRRQATLFVGVQTKRGQSPAPWLSPSPRLAWTTAPLPPLSPTWGLVTEGPIRQPKRGGEWEPIKILLEGDLNSNKMNSLGRTPKITRSTLLPSVCQNHVATRVLLVLGTNTTSNLNSYAPTTAETTRELAVQRGQLDRVWGAVRPSPPGNQEILRNTSSEHQNAPRFHQQRSLVKAVLATRKSW